MQTSFISSGDSRIIDKSLVIKKEKLLREERELLRLRTKGLISHENYAKELDMVLREIEKLDKEMLKMKPQVLKASECTPIEQFDEDKLNKFIQKIVIKNYEVEFVFINFIKVKKHIPTENTGISENG